MEADLAAAEARLRASRSAWPPSAAGSCGLRKRLTEGRDELSAQLVTSYKQDQPDFVSLVIASHDFADLIERVEYVKRLQERNGEIVDRVHGADDTDRQADRLAELEIERQRDGRRRRAPP